MSSDRYYERDSSLTIEVDAGVGDSIQFTDVKEGLCIEIEEPWAGSTETGFGAISRVTLLKTDVFRLMSWLRDKGY